MSTFRRFEEIEAWQKARDITRSIYSISSQGSFSKDYALRDQIRRASISIVSNIAEGFERGGTKEFVQFLSVAKGSIGEVRSQLYIALDQGYIDRKMFDEISNLALETGRVIAGLMRYLRQTAIKGNKYRTPETRN
ncbi:MAG: four helix bundle protein [Bacteroidota bacterium]